jgi:drug/metabolite transporter (DMT)-like permease
MAEGQTKPFNKILLLILIGLMILTGSINTIFNKILQKLYGKGVIFEQHHWIITFGMFLGELVSIFLYAYIVYKRKKQALQKQDDNLLKESEERLENQGEGEGQENAPTDDKKDATEAEKKLRPIPTNFFFCVTAGCDLCATTINTFGLTYLTTSMFQMMRGLELFFVCLWSKIFLKNPIYRHAYLGIGSLIFGLALVGVNSYIFKDDNTEVAKNPIVGIILMSTSQLFSSTEYVFQEKFIKHYEVHPFQLVGFEGLWGSCMYAILLIIFQYADCAEWGQDIREGVCFYYEETYSVNFNGTQYVEYNKTISKIEDTDFAFKQMGDNLSLLFVYIFYIISIAMYNIVGINLTKLVSSTARAVVDTVRTVFIWGFFLIFEPVEGTHETFYPLQFVGFCFLVFGTLVYNEIVVLPFWGFDYNTRDNRAKREAAEREANTAKGPDENARLYENSVDGKESNANSDAPKDSPNA